MKRLLLSALAVLTIGLYTACSSDTDISTAEDNVKYANRGLAWEGEIGIERNGEFFITADETELRTELEMLLLEQGIETTLYQLQIVEKRLVNAPTKSAYVLLGTDANNLSVGVSLAKTDRSFALEDPLTTVATTCSGCATGCNLQYLLIDGKKIPYCNENGCTYDCTKSETSLF